MANSDWFSWNDGETRISVRVQDVVAVKHRGRTDVSAVYVRGGSSLEIGHADAGKLKALIGADQEQKS